MNVRWPSPRALEGVKSKERAIFEIRDAVLNVDGKDSDATNVFLALESRVVAVGPAGRALADVVLGWEKPISGSATRHDDLVVLHIGPHLVDTDAIATALEVRPHVLVVSDAGDDDGHWTGMFEEFLRSKELNNFKGAVVVCASQEDRVPEGLCRTRWVGIGGSIHTETVALRVTVIDDLCGKAKVDPSHNPLLAQATELASSFFSNENMHEFIEQGWTVVALTTTTPSGDAELIGYMTYNAEASLDAMCLQRMAVFPKYRRRGFASQLVSWMIERTKKSDYDSLWVHAVPKLQSINSALGFSYVDPADEIRPDEEKESAWMTFSLHVESPTIFEEARLPPRRKKEKRRKGR